MTSFQLRIFRLAAPFLFALTTALCIAENDVSYRVFPINAEGIITVQSTSGVVKVGVWDRDEVRVDMIRRAENPDALEQVQVQFESGYNSLSVVTEIAKGVGQFGETVTAGTIDLGLTIPRNASIEVTATTASVRIEGVRGSVKADTTTGALTTLDLAGAVTVATTHGPLQAAFAMIREDQRINVTSEYGTIRLLIPPSVSAHLTVRAPRGPMRTDLPLEILEDSNGGHRIDAAMNSGGAHIHCETQFGGIVVLRRM